MFSDSRKQNALEDGQMFLRSIGSGSKVQYVLSSYSTQQIEWVSAEADTEGNPISRRTPTEQTTEFLAGLPFTFGGKTYPNFSLFIRHKEDRLWATDLFGREILCLTKRFPCFDSYDYLNETRHYRWFFLREGNCLHRLFATDGQKKIYVTQDVCNLESDCWQKMQELGYCQNIQKA